MSENNCLKFKPIRSGLQLFLFQISCSIFAAIIISLLPKSGYMDSSSNFTAFIGAFLGGQFYGSRIERKFPGFLDIKKIKIISLWNALINLILISIVVLIAYSTGFPIGDSIQINSSIEIMIFVAVAIILLPIDYFISKFSIKSGVNRVRRKCKTYGQLTDTLG